MRSMHSDQLRAWVEVDLDALLHNATSLQHRCGVPLLPMVKADAYGLGALEVVARLERISPWGFGVATIDEGESLRIAGVRRPILVFTPPLAAELHRLAALELTPALGDREMIATWCEGRLGPWHLAIETGMNRAGLRWSSVGDVTDFCRAFPPQGAFTHFHSPELDNGSVEVQESRFREAIAALPGRPSLLHCENSGAITRRSHSEWDFVRPGVFLYGVGSGSSSALQPKAVVSLRGRIVEQHTLQDGDTVSYDATYSAQGRRRIATAALGYADGLRRSLSNVGSALVRGVTVPMVGMVTMDMTMLDVTEVACDIGDVATFIGESEGSQISVEGVGTAAGLSPYEILTGLHARLPRLYSS